MASPRGAQRRSDDPETPLIEAISGALDTGVLTETDRVLVALSGGADSCALLLALSQFAHQRGYPSLIGVAHFHHQMRGADADADAAFCAALCARCGQPCTIGLGAQAGANEADARRARYDFLIETARERGANAIATAHTADDVAETVLLRVLRGTGVDGLGGIPSRRTLAQTDGIVVIRPILTVRRFQISRFLETQNIVPRHDPTNDDPRYPRSRARQLLPELAEAFNPRLVEALNRLARNAAADSALLGQLARRLCDEARGPDTDSDNAARWNLAPLRPVPPALRRRALRRMLWEVYRNDLKHRAEADTLFWVDRLETLTDWPGALDLPGGVRVEQGDDTLTFSRQSPDGAANLPTALPLPIPGMVILWGDTGRIVADRDTPLSPDERRRGSDFIDIDPASVGDGLFVRAPVDGDRISPLGMNGRSRLVRDLLRDAKIPAGKRGSHPLIVRADGAILWIAAVAQSDETRIQPDISEAVLLRWERSPDKLEN